MVNIDDFNAKQQELKDSQTKLQQTKDELNKKELEKAQLENENDKADLINQLSSEINLLKEKAKEYEEQIQSISSDLVSLQNNISFYENKNNNLEDIATPTGFSKALNQLLIDIEDARTGINKRKQTKEGKNTMNNAEKKLKKYEDKIKTKLESFQKQANPQVYESDIQLVKSLQNDIEQAKYDISQGQWGERSNSASFYYDSPENAKKANRSMEKTMKLQQKMNEEVHRGAILNIFENNINNATDFYRKIAEGRYDHADYTFFLANAAILSPSFQKCGIAIPADPTITVRNLSSTPTTDYSNLEWGETFQKGGIAGLIDKGLSNCKNMTPGQRTSRKNIAVLGCVAGGIYGLYKFFTNKKMSFWSKALTTGGVIFASQALTGEGPLALFNKLMKGGFSADYLESRFGNLFGEAVNGVGNSGIETIAPAMYSMMIFNSSTTIGEINTMTQNFKQDNQARKTFYEESINKLSKGGTQTAEYFRVTFSDTFDEQKRNNWLESFGVVDISNQSNSDKTVYELANNASMNQVVIEKFKSENGIKVTDNKTKKEEFKQYINGLKTNNQAIDIQTLGQHKYDWFEPDGEATYTERPEDEQNIKGLEGQIDHLSLDETKKDELKRAIKKFYNERTIDTKPILSDFSLKMSDGKLILQSHDGEEAEIDIDRGKLVGFGHRFTDFSELLNAADLSNKILEGQRGSTPKELPAFKYKPERRGICFNNANNIRKDLITRDNTGKDIRVLSTGRGAANTAVAKTEKFLGIGGTASKIENLYTYPNEFASYLSDRRKKQHTNS